MTRPVSDIAFTPTVKALQVQHGSREAYARMEREQGWKQTQWEKNIPGHITNADTNWPMIKDRAPAELS